MSQAFDQLTEVMKTLRGPQGCMWDKEQTHETLKYYLIEEAYEVIEAVESGNPEKLNEELGDLLFLIVFHCQIGLEKQEFDYDSVIRTVAEKMRRRHPHVFGNVEVQNVEDIRKNWEKIKQTEDSHQDRHSVTDGIPKHLPALLKALKIQKKVTKVGFNWKTPAPLFEKTLEELNELQKASKTADQQHMEEEFGDLLFSLVNLGRHFQINPEQALTRANEKFRQRFQHMEKLLKTRGNKGLENIAPEEWQNLWNESKKYLP